MKTCLRFAHFHLWPTVQPSIPYGSSTLSPLILSLLPPLSLSCGGPGAACRDKLETLKKRRWRTPRGGDGEEERRWGEKEKCILYFSNGWEMIRWDLLTIIRWGLINSGHSQHGEGWSPSTKEQAVGGRYLRKHWPGVSNMRQHSPPHTLHCSIWLLSELISWRIKANRRDERACGCLRYTLPCPSSPSGMRLTDKGHCVWHLDRHTSHLPCHTVQFDEVIWQRKQDLVTDLGERTHCTNA